MPKKRKLHQLKGTIKYCWPGQVKSKSRYRDQNFYCLEIIQQNLFTNSQALTIYAFSNLLSKTILKTLEQQTYKGKTYHFFCEKRVRGWRLKDWEEITEN